MASTALAIRDVDEGKFGVLNSAFWIADAAWWAIRVLDWRYSDRYGDWNDRPSDDRGQTARIIDCFGSATHALKNAAREREYELKEREQELEERVAALFDPMPEPELDMSTDDASQVIMEALNRVVAAGFVVEISSLGTGLRIYPAAYPEGTAVYLWETAHGDWEIDGE